MTIPESLRDLPRVHKAINRKMRFGDLVRYGNILHTVLKKSPEEPEKGEVLSYVLQSYQETADGDVKSFRTEIRVFPDGDFREEREVFDLD